MYVCVFVTDFVYVYCHLGLVDKAVTLHVKQVLLFPILKILDLPSNPPLSLFFQTVFHFEECSRNENSEEKIVCLCSV